ncbi:MULTISPECIES: hypothetical protein [Novosphingobium]|uniref:Preprotein translocase subunit YajC n=1 Tax=Novosphingobium pentaromativorans TaxID=205844 RepID=A0A2W5NV09_9SPHN|nr:MULTISPECIES: hypothetical protein [Novosphingobium]PZQ56178.1 MAG: hypothetical protein DI555_05995 [Novosphingobium pentaromativorans]GFE74443.1 hypothetical protein NTCA1_20920 [Novosphingobium sp. TCA1]
MKKSLIAAAIAAATLTPAAAMAQGTAATAAAAPTVGAKVYGPDGTEVGTVEAVQSGVVTVNTGTARAGLPAASFAMREKGLTIGMNKADLEAAVNGAKAESSAELATAFVADKPIKSSDGVVLGTVTKVEGEDVFVTLSNGSVAQLKKSYFGLGADKSLTLGMTATAFNSQLQASAGGQPGADAQAAPSATAGAAETPSGQ